MKLLKRIRAARQEHQRGAALVETAILLPVIVGLLFGIIEFSMLYSTSAKVNDSTRAGARVGASMARDPNYSTAIAQAAGSVLKEIPPDAPQEIWIFKANAQGYPGADGNTSFTTCATNCIQYNWDPATRAFNTGSPGGGGWDATSHQICALPYDQVGVYVNIDHRYITQLFGNTKTLTDHSVFRFEPKAATVCGNP